MCFMTFSYFHLILGVTPFRSIVEILNEKEGGDSELCLFSMTLINKVNINSRLFNTFSVSTLSCQIFVVKLVNSVFHIFSCFICLSICIYLMWKFLLKIYLLISKVSPNSMFSWLFFGFTCILCGEHCAVNTVLSLLFLANS